MTPLSIFDHEKACIYGVYHNLKIKRKHKEIIQDKFNYTRNWNTFLITIKLYYIAKDTLRSEILPMKN